MSLFEDARSELRELLDLVEYIDRMSLDIARGNKFQTQEARSEFERMQRRAGYLRDKYGL